jgi:SNF2 family DNA or RNA helicase
MNSVAQPNDLSINLYPHQLNHIYKMEELERTNIAYTSDHRTITTKMGFSSDPTGYGKTLSTIGLIVRDRMEWTQETDYTHVSRTYANGLINHTHRNNVYEKLPTTLILVPKSILKQWLTELYISSSQVCLQKE